MNEVQNFEPLNNLELGMDVGVAAIAEMGSTMEGNIANIQTFQNLTNPTLLGEAIQRMWDMSRFVIITLSLLSLHSDDFAAPIKY